MIREFAFPGTRPRYAPDRVVDIQHIALVLDVDPTKRTVAGTATLRARAIAPGTSVGRARCGRARRSTRSPRTASRRRFATTARSCASSCPRRSPPAPSSRSRSTYRGAPRRGLYFIAPDDGYPDKPTQVWTQGQDEDSRYWFPCFDAPHEKATSEVNVDRAGDACSRCRTACWSPTRPTATRRTLHWRLDVPHSCYLVTLAVGEFATIETTWRDTPVVYYVAARARGRRASARSRARRRCSSCSRRSSASPYPYPRYAQVFVADFIFGGMENTSATTLTDTCCSTSAPRSTTTSTRSSRTSSRTSGSAIS